MSSFRKAAKAQAKRAALTGQKKAAFGPAHAKLRGWSASAAMAVQQIETAIEFPAHKRSFRVKVPVPIDPPSPRAPSVPARREAEDNMIQRLWKELGMSPQEARSLLRSALTRTLSRPAVAAVLNAAYRLRVESPHHEDALGPEGELYAVRAVLYRAGPRRWNGPCPELLEGSQQLADALLRAFEGVPDGLLLATFRTMESQYGLDPRDAEQLDVFLENGVRDYARVAERDKDLYPR